MLPIIRTHGPNRIELARWGFWPEEWKRSKHSRAMINARLETAAEKPMFASSFQGRHCMVLTDGYYEWRTIGKHKQPYRITLKTGEPFAMAGIREATEFNTAEKTGQFRNPHDQGKRSSQLHPRADARDPSAQQ
jgi:putative SOS response-associated peptidase YedK